MKSQEATPTTQELHSICPPLPPKRPPASGRDIDPSICRRLFSDHPHHDIIGRTSNAIRVNEVNLESRPPSLKNHRAKMTQKGKQVAVVVVEECRSSCPPLPPKRIPLLLRRPINPSICRRLFSHPHGIEEPPHLASSLQRRTAMKGTLKFRPMSSTIVPPSKYSVNSDAAYGNVLKQRNVDVEENVSTRFRELSLKEIAPNVQLDLQPNRLHDRGVSKCEEPWMRTTTSNTAELCCEFEDKEAVTESL